MRCLSVKRTNVILPENQAGGLLLYDKNDVPSQLISMAGISKRPRRNTQQNLAWRGGWLNSKQGKNSICGGRW